jgi:hypothetical protein
MFDTTRAAGATGEAFAALAKASPPLAVSATAAVGWTLQDWVLIATLVYTLMQAAYLVYKFVRERGADRGSSIRDDV